MPKGRMPFSKITKEIKAVMEFLDGLNKEIARTNGKEDMSELAKRIIGMVKVQHSLPHVSCIPDNDRIIPLEGVKKDSFRLKNNVNLDDVAIHYGPYANELTRSRNILALALGTDIFIRNGAYRPETEEGRTLIAHELTHVAQHTEKRITKDRSQKTLLEEEAERNENKEIYNPDPVIEKTICGEHFRMKKSQYRMIELLIKEKIEEKLEERCNMFKYEKRQKMVRTYNDVKDSGELDAWLNEQ